jgi:hypothetical protein
VDAAVALELARIRPLSNGASVLCLDGVSNDARLLERRGCRCVEGARNKARSAAECAPQSKATRRIGSGGTGGRRSGLGRSATSKATVAGSGDC